MKENMSLNNCLTPLRELDPAPNPPYFNSYVIKATLDYLSKCHSANHKSLVAILSKTPVRCLIFPHVLSLINIF